MSLPIFSQSLLYSVSGISTFLWTTRTCELFPFNDPELLSIVKPASKPKLYSFTFWIKHTISVKFLSLSSVYLVPSFDKSTSAIRCGKSITLCQHLIGIVHQIFLLNCLATWQSNHYNLLIHTFAVLQIKCQYNFYTNVLSM